MSDNKQNNLEKKVQEKISDYKNTTVDYDRTRYANKVMLKELVNTWRKEIAEYNEILQDAELMDLFENVEKYASIDVTGSHQGNMAEMGTYRQTGQTHFEIMSNYQAERMLFDSILQKVSTYTDRLQRDIDSDKIRYSQTARASQILDYKYLIATNLEMYFESQRDGYLEPISENAKQIKETDIEYLKKEIHIESEKDSPLFPHDPSVTDLYQGSIGNCYMVASFSVIAAKSPKKIKEMMKDNGDGTVTVRLYNRISPIDQTEPKNDHDIFEPFYVTVKKEVPAHTGAQHCLWASVLERALVISGRFVPGKTDEDRRLVPPNINELYETYKNMPEDERPTHEECPWLFDEKDNLIPWKPSYEHIGNGGQSHKVIETLLGAEAIGKKVELHLDNITTKPDYPVAYYKQLVEKKTSGEYVKQLENYFKELNTSHGSEKQWAIAATAILSYKPESENAEFPLLQVDANFVPVNMPFDGMTYSYIESIGEEARRIAEQREDDEETLDGIFEEAWHNTDSLNIIVDGKRIFSEVDPEIKNFMKMVASDDTPIFHRIMTNYSDEEEKIYANMETSLKQGAILTAGTTSNPYNVEEQDNRSENGLHFGHAYSIIGFTEEEHEGNTYKYIIVRDPHGSNCATEYDYSQVPPRPYESTAKEVEGIFKVELKHFVSMFHNIYYNVNEPVPKTKMPEKQVTRSMASRYKRIFNDLEKDLFSLENQGEGFEELKKDWQSYKRYLSTSAGKVFDAKTSISGVLNSLSKLKIKSESGQKQLEKLKKTLSGTAELMNQGIENPKQHVLSELTGGVLYEKLPASKVMAHQVKNEFGSGIENNKWEAKKALEILDQVDPFYISSSQQFRDLKDGLKELINYTDTYNTTKGGPAIIEYCDKLDQLNKLATNYLDYKEYKNEKNRSSNEKARIDVVKTIQRYTCEKQEGVKKEYFKVRIAEKICEDKFTGNISPKEKLDMIRNITKSPQLKAMTAPKNSSELSELYNDSDKMRVFIAVYTDELSKNVDKNPANRIAKHNSPIPKQMDTSKVNSENVTTLLYN